MLIDKAVISFCVLCSKDVLHLHQNCALLSNYLRRFFLFFNNGFAFANKHRLLYFRLYLFFFYLLNFLFLLFNFLLFDWALFFLWAFRVIEVVFFSSPTFLDVSFSLVFKQTHHLSEPKLIICLNKFFIFFSWLSEFV